MLRRALTLVSSIRRQLLQVVVRTLDLEACMLVAGGLVGTCLGLLYRLLCRSEQICLFELDSQLLLSMDPHEVKLGELELIRLLDDREKSK